LIGIFASNAFAFEPSYTNYFSNPEFRIYKIQENTYEFSIPYKISNAELDKINIDCDSTALIVYLDKVEVDGNFIVNIPRTLLDMKINDKDDDFIVIIDNLETEYQETYTDLDSRTLDIPLRPDSKILEIIATNTGMFPEPVPCAIGSSDESSYYRLMSPLKQFKSGVAIDQIQCKDEFVVVIKKSNGIPNCVKDETLEKLREGGWAKLLFEIQIRPSQTKQESNDTSSESNYDPSQVRCSSGVFPLIPKDWQSTGKHPSNETWETLDRHLMSQFFFKELQERNIIFKPACFGIYTGFVETSYPPRYSMCSMVTASNGTDIYLEGTIREFNVDYFAIDDKIPYQCDDNHHGCLCGLENEN